MCEHTSASHASEAYDWPIDASANETLRETAARKKLRPGQIDERLKEVKHRIFNKMIEEALTSIQPVIATFEASAPTFAGKIGSDLKNPGLYLQGNRTYIRAHALFQKLVDRHQRSHELRILHGIVHNLSYIDAQKERRRTPSKAQIQESHEQMTLALASIQKTWPTKVAECQTILQQDHSLEGVQAVYLELKTLCENEDNYLTEMSQILLDTIREGSSKAFAKYEKIVIRNLTASCEYCHKQDTWHTPGQFVFTLKKCADCKKVFYCSHECQRADWARHKLECQHTSKRP